MSVQLELFEEKNRREAALYTAFVTIALLCLFYFITIFKDADIVKPDYGIEVNFGTSDKGYGNIQTHNQASDIKEAIESAPPKANVNKINTAPVEKVAEPKVEKVKELTKTEAAVTSKVESPVKVKEVEDKKVKPVIPKVEAVKPAPSKPAPEKVEPVKPTPAPPKPDAGSLYSKPGSKTGGNGTIGTSNKAGGNNNGDGAKGEIGDKGDPNGKIDAPLYSGKPGSGGGSASGNSLSLTGWKFSKGLSVNDNSDETGTIKFQIKVDDQGEVLSVSVLSSTVSRSIVNLYKQAIEKATFVATGTGSRPAVSTGTINIKINPRN